MNPEDYLFQGQGEHIEAKCGSTRQERPFFPNGGFTLKLEPSSR
jgi:hypothetical protein